MIRGPVWRNRQPEGQVKAFIFDFLVERRKTSQAASFLLLVDVRIIIIIIVIILYSSPIAYNKASVKGEMKKEVSRSEGDRGWGGGGGGGGGEVNDWMNRWSRDIFLVRNRVPV